MTCLEQSMCLRGKKQIISKMQNESRTDHVDRAVSGPGQVRAHLERSEGCSHLRKKPVVCAHQRRRRTA